MNTLKKFISIIFIFALTICLLCACGNKAVSESENIVPVETEAAVVTQTTEPAETLIPAGDYQVGDKIDDFTVTTCDGREISLYQILEEKDMVLLNLWATYCGPCASEFPAMQEAYEQYQDKVEIIALSTHAPDTDEIIAAYAQEKGMTFCVAKDTVGLGSRINSDGIPTSIVVDRFGTICLIEAGAMPDPSIFTNLFALFTAEDYTESLFLPSMLAEKPDVQPADPEALNNALNGECGTLVFNNSANAFYWPMTVEEKDGRVVVAASNGNSSYSKAVVETQVDVNAGDVLVVEYKLENDIYFNMMCVEVDGVAVKKVVPSKDWGTYAYRFAEAGRHEVRVSYDVKMAMDDLNSNLWIDSICIASGEEADKALANNPQYPVGEKIQMEILNENIQKAYYYDEAAPDVKMLMYFSTEPAIRVHVTLDETVDPETAYVQDTNYNAYMLAPNATEDGYVMEIPIDGEAAGVGIVLYYDGEAYSGIDIYHSEEEAEQVFDLIREALGQSYKWDYWDESVEILEVSGDATYTVTYVDQNGDPVPGVMCQVCDESTCQVFVSDANGICQFTLPAKGYEIHTLMVPAGYEGDTDTVTNAPATGGEFTFTLTKK